MKTFSIETKKSIGRVIAHDITRIEMGSFKGPAFKKGHIIKEEDVEILLSLGKKHIYSIEIEPSELHEDEAGLRLASSLQGPGLIIKGPSEGRLNLLAEQRGLLKIDVARLERINSIADIVVATLHTNSSVDKGEMVAGVKVIPLIVKEEVVKEVEDICMDSPPLTVLSYQRLKVGGVITGSEVIEGRIKDDFGPILSKKTSYYGLEQPQLLYADDNVALIAAKLKELLARGCNLIIVTGGMSVDPDDVTPLGIREAGAELVKYGAPALPGGMFLLAYLDEIPVIGLPACAMYYKSTVLDVVLPRIIAGEILKAEDINKLGHGGLCRQCRQCFFPNCSFGKGVI